MNLLQGVPDMLRHALSVIAALLAGSPADQRPARLGPFEAPSPRLLLTPAGGETFSPIEALHGSVGRSGQCRTIGDAVWIEVEGKGDCIRYYPAGLRAAGQTVAIIVFGGDVLLRTNSGERFIASAYGRKSPASMREQAEDLSFRAGLPVIHVARPGLYGSSGDHGQRRHVREVDLMDRAVSAIARKYGISSLILVGQSGGGHISAALLSRRADIKAAIISSGLVSVAAVMDYWEDRRSIPGSQLYDAAMFYDPMDHVAAINRASPPDIILISDLLDSVVPFETQLQYVEGLRRSGLKPVHIIADADGANHHSMSRHAEMAAILYAGGRSGEEIRNRVGALVPAQ